jgi:hypothetical protein
MSDWEDFCDSKGWNAGSEADYDRFLDSLEDKPARGAVVRREMGQNHEMIFFSSFEEAKQWAKNNVGQVFTRSADGSGFISIKKKNIENEKVAPLRSYKRTPKPDVSHAQRSSIRTDFLRHE